MFQNVRSMSVKIVGKLRNDVELVMIFSRETNVGECIEHSEEGGTARSCCGDEEEQSLGAGCAEW